MRKKKTKRSKSTRDQNPPAFKIHQIKIHPFFFCLFSLLINLFYVFFAFFKIYIFYHSYPLRSIGKRFSNLTGWVLIGCILNAGGFRSRVDFERVPYFIFYWFSTTTVTPNPYSQSVSGCRIWLGGFWTQVDSERVP